MPTPLPILFHWWGSLDVFLLFTHFMTFFPTHHHLVRSRATTQLSNIVSGEMKSFFTQSHSNTPPSLPPPSPPPSSLSFKPDSFFPNSLQIKTQITRHVEAKPNKERKDHRRGIKTRSSVRRITGVQNSTGTRINLNRCTLSKSQQCPCMQDTRKYRLQKFLIRVYALSQQ